MIIIIIKSPNQKTPRWRCEAQVLPLLDEWVQTFLLGVGSRAAPSADVIPLLLWLPVSPLNTPTFPRKKTTFRGTASGRSQSRRSGGKGQSC